MCVFIPLDVLVILDGKFTDAFPVSVVKLLYFLHPTVEQCLELLKHPLKASRVTERHSQLDRLHSNEQKGHCKL
jgi:hypothetical protein